MNINDYIKNYGLLNFNDLPFNEVDNLILSYLSYVNLDKVYKDYMTIKEASDAYFTYYTPEQLNQDKTFYKKSKYLMQDMANSNRFGNLKICNYVNIIDEIKEVQFSAMTIELNKISAYIAFRGTDDTLVAWKEDLHMSIGLVPAQEMAARYLNHVDDSFKFLRLGGHSKGGNLAIYAAAACSPEIKNRIIRIYSNDGPGFSEEFMTERNIYSLSDKIVHIVPEYSVIGMLMEQPVKSTVIKSNGITLGQHDGFSWQLDETRFQKSHLSQFSETTNRILLKWLEGISFHKRDEFIDDLFNILQASGAETLTDIQELGLNNLTPMLNELNNVSEDSKKVIEALFKTFTQDLESNNQFIHKMREIFNIPIE